MQIMTVKEKLICRSVEQVGGEAARSSVSADVSTPVLGGKRIVIVLEFLTLGGAERQSILLAHKLMRKYGAVVEVIAFSQPGEGAALCDELGVPWQIIPFDWPTGRLQKMINLFNLAVALRNLRPDIILSYTMLPNVTCGLVWRWTGATACIWNQRAGNINRKERRAEQWAVRQLRKFVSNSHHGAKFLVEELGVDPGNVSIVHNGVELFPGTATKNEWRNKLGLGDDWFVACMIANLHFRKDHDTLIKAWKSVVGNLSSVGCNAILLLAGLPAPSTEARLKQLATDLEIHEHVRFLGYVKDIAGLLDSVDLGVFSSKSEGSPNGVLECMAAGLAVAGTDIPGIREALGVNGFPFLAPPGDATGLAHTIVRLASDSGLRRRLGDGNRLRIDEEFSVDAMCKKMVAIINGTLN